MKYLIIRYIFHLVFLISFILLIICMFFKYNFYHIPFALSYMFFFTSGVLIGMFFMAYLDNYKKIFKK
jgi:hypothetical protein